MVKSFASMVVLLNATSTGSWARCRPHIRGRGTGRRRPVPQRCCCIPLPFSVCFVGRLEPAASSGSLHRLTASRVERLCRIRTGLLCPYSAVSLLGQTGSFRLIRVLSLAAIQNSLPALTTYGRFNLGRSVVLELKLGRARSQRRGPRAIGGGDAQTVDSAARYRSG